MAADPKPAPPLTLPTPAEVAAVIKELERNLRLKRRQLATLLAMQAAGDLPAGESTDGE